MILNSREINIKSISVDNTKRNLRDLIDGCLNRISITDDDTERLAMAENINLYVSKYIVLSRQYKELYNQLKNG